MCRINLVLSIFLLSLVLTITASFAAVINSAMVFDSTNFEEAIQLQSVIDQPESKIDFAIDKLTIDKMVDRSIDMDANINNIAVIVKSINSMLPINPTSMDKMLTIKKYLYVSGTWNDFKAYQYDFNDPKGTLIKNNLIPTYLTTRKGNCVSMPILFVVLGQKLGIDVSISTAPQHLLVKFTESETGTTYNIETTSGANFSRDVWYQQTMHITDEALNNKVYLQKLTKRETVAVMAMELVENYAQKQEYEKAMMISDVLLKNYPNNIDSMVWKGSLFYKMLAKCYITKYPMPNLIPQSERPYFEFLSMNNQFWFQKAESLGWREPTEEDDKKYLETVRKDARIMQNQE